MANFLRDYIAQRGEDTVIRTIYGILDNKSGEHLVPVQHAERYFKDYPLINIDSYPNQPIIMGENGEVLPPVITFDQMVRIVDPVFPYNVTFTGTVSIPDLGEFNRTTATAKIEDDDNSLLSFVDETKWESSLVVTSAPADKNFTCVMMGQTIHGENLSEFTTETYSVSFAFTPAAPQIVFMGINGTKPIDGQTLDIDGTVSNVDIQIMTGAYPSETNTALDDYRLKINATENVATEQTPSLNWNFSTPMGGFNIGSENILTVSGRASADDLFSEYGSVVAKVKPWRAPEFSTNLPASASETYQDSDLNLTIAVNSASAPSPYSYDWKKDGVSIEADSSPNLEIIKPTVQASGVYTCEVTDKLGRKFTTRNHTVNCYNLMSWRQDISENVLSAQVGDDITLTVDPQGGKAPITVTWIHDVSGVKNNVGSGNTLTFTAAADSGGLYYAEATCVINGQTKKISSNTCEVTIT